MKIITIILPSTKKKIKTFNENHPCPKITTSVHPFFVFFFFLFCFVNSRRHRSFWMRVFGSCQSTTACPHTLWSAWYNGGGVMQSGILIRLECQNHEGRFLGFGRDRLGAVLGSFCPRALRRGPAGEEKRRSDPVLLLGGLFMFLHPFYRSWDGEPWGESCFPGASPGAVWHNTPSTRRRRTRRRSRREVGEGGG